MTALALRIAMRDLRGSFRGFGVFLACIALGVAAIAAVGNLNRSVADALNRDARQLLGGDFAIEQSAQPLTPQQLAPLVPTGSRTSTTVRTNAIARAPSGRSLAVVLKSVDDAHPLLGEVRLDPQRPLAETLADAGIAVEPAFLARLSVKVGDRVRLGDGEVTVTAVLVREPDRLGGAVSLGPRVLASTTTLEQLGIIRPGSLVRYETRVVTPPGTDADGWARSLTAANPDAGWRIETASEVQPDAARLTDRLATFLTLAGLAALITGGLGIGLAVQSHLARRTATIAVLKCVGASGTMIFTVFLLQIVLLASVGVVVGLVLGQALPIATRLLPEGTLPVALDYRLYPAPLLLAAGCGLLTALVFALWPLALAREVTPASLFRSMVQDQRVWPRRVHLAQLGVAVAALAALAVVGVPRPELGAWFVVGTAFCLAGLALLARALLRLLRGAGGRGGFAWRMAIGTLTRHGSGSVSVVTALGTGLAVLVMVALLQRTLTVEVEQSLPARAPAVLFIDIQPGQRDAFTRTVAEAGGGVLQMLPSLRARVVRIADEPADAEKVAPEVRWTINRDRGLTYLAQRPDDVSLVEGEWWPADYAGPPLLSIDAEIARGYGVGIGDTLAFNILGRTIDARITNLRDEVDWGAGRLDFMFIMSPGLLDKAPHTLVASAEVPPGAEPALLDAMAERLPNVTPISIRDVLAQVAEVLGKIGFAVNAVAAVTLGAGLLVLAAAVAAARQRHLYTSVLLKVLGARRSVVLRSFLVEYGLLGSAAAVCGCVLGSVSAWAITVLVMNLPWRFAMLPVAVIATLAVTLSLVVGAVGLWRLLGRSAASVLRTA